MNIFITYYSFDFFFFSSRRRHTSLQGDWSSDVCSSDLFDKLFWFGKGEWVYIGMPFIEISTLFVSTMLYKYMVEEKEKRKVKGTFSLYLSKEIGRASCRERHMSIVGTVEAQKEEL